MTPQQTAEFLQSHDNYLILTHVRPDGDTIGCAAGLCVALRQLGKTAFVLPNPQTTTLFSHYVEPYYPAEGWEPATVVTVDVAARTMFPLNGQEYLERVDLAIDHHGSQEFFARETCVDPSRAACGELIYDIVRQFTTVTADIALPLYVAISTDCGCFVYGNTTADTHRIAAALMETGIPVAKLNKFHFRTKSVVRMKLESALIAAMQLYDDDTVAIAPVSIAMMEKLGATERDAEDLSALVGVLEGVKTGVTIREHPDNRCKLSVRTDPDDLNASDVCALLGGGGHAAAAGASVTGSLEQAIEMVLAAIHQVKAASAASKE